MRSLRMFAGAAVLAAPVFSFIAAFGAGLPWPLWAGITLVCTIIGATMSYYRLPLPVEETDAYGAASRDT